MLRDKTLKEILEDPAIAEIAPEAISKWDLSKEEYYHWTLQEIADRMGWDCLERGFDTLFKAAARGKYCFKLYSESECAEAPAKKAPASFGCRPAWRRRIIGRLSCWFPAEGSSTSGI